MVEASNSEAAVGILQTQGLYVSSIEKISVPIYAKRIALFDKVSNKEIVMFSRQISILLKSQVPLVETLTTLAQQTKKSGFKEKLEKIREKIEGGTSLSEALSMYPKIFSKFYVSMIKSGEATGKMVDVFVYLADYLEKDYKFKAKIKGAMIYPAFILVVFLGVSGLIVTMVIPQIAGVLKQSNQDLPGITKFVMGISDFMQKYWWIVLLGIVAVVFSFIRVIRTESGKKIFDRVILSIPVVGMFLKKIYIERFAMNLSTLIAGGLPIVTSLEITANIVGNDVYRNIIIETTEEIRKGETISSVLDRYPTFIFPLFYQMVMVGEKTGTLDSCLKNVVDFYEDDVDRALDSLLKLLEPLLIVLLGGTVGFLLGAVLIPIYSMTGQ